MKPVIAFMGLFLAIAGVQLSSNVAAAEQLPGNDPNVSGCAPHPGEGARWLAPCEKAAMAGDGQAALTVGAIYWNGDGVPKDNASAARWWKMAYQDGRPEAAKLLGDEAYVRMAQAPGPLKVDRAVLDEATGWYKKAVEVEPNPVLRQQAQSRLDQLAQFKSLLPPP